MSLVECRRFGERPTAFSMLMVVTVGIPSLVGTARKFVRLVEVRSRRSWLRWRARPSATPSFVAVQCFLFPKFYDLRIGEVLADPIEDIHVVRHNCRQIIPLAAKRGEPIQLRNQSTKRFKNMQAGAMFEDEFAKCSEARERGEITQIPTLSHPKCFERGKSGERREIS